MARRNPPKKPTKANLGKLPQSAATPSSPPGISASFSGDPRNLPPPPAPVMPGVTQPVPMFPPLPLMPVPQQVQNYSPPPAAASIPWTDAIGQTGLKRPPWRGQIYEEFLAELTGRRGVQTYREMRDNDSVIGAVMYAIESTLAAVEWRVEGENEENRTFVEECLSDMRPNFSLTVNEILSHLTYGWSVHEVVYKLRSGPSGDALTSSKYTDGRLGWQGWPIRSQDSLFGWDWDQRGVTVNMLQQAPPFYTMTAIPLNRCLHFRTTTSKDNPEGRSLLRSAYRAWWFRRNVQTIEAIGIERDIAGMPVIRRAEAFKNLDSQFQSILRNVRQDENSGVIIPKVIDPQTGKDLIEFELMSAPGAKQIDTNPVMERYGREIAMVMLADFIMLGHEAVGSFALSNSKTAMFARGLKRVLENIRTVINEEAIPRLFAVNGMPTEDLPKIEYGDIETPDLAELGAYVQALSSSGATLFPDENLENYLRRVASLPEKSEEVAALQEETRQQMAALASMVTRNQPTDTEDDPEEDDTNVEE